MLVQLLYVYAHDVVEHDAVPVYVHFAIVESHRVAVTVSLITGPVSTSSVKLTVGHNLSICITTHVRAVSAVPKLSTE